MDINALIQQLLTQRMGQPAQPQYGLQGPIPGMTQRGNIDIANRPVTNNPDGSISTVNSMNVGLGGHEVLMPTIGPQGRQMTDDEAIQHHLRTKQHLGKFADPMSAEAYAKALHDQQEGQYPKQMGPLGSGMFGVPTKSLWGGW